MTHQLSFNRLWQMILISIIITGCQPPDPETIDNNTAADGWPRTFSTSKGAVTLNTQPKRVVSTSVSLTGTLLSIDAPLIASSAGQPQFNIADEQGFFTQWSHVAKARQLQVLYQMEPNAEAIAAVNPDLIIISAGGADSALKLYEQLSAIAPAIVVSYNDQSWQALTLQLGKITGHEAKAQQIIDAFNKRVQSVAQQITLPPQPTSALFYQLDGRDAYIWTDYSAQGELLQQLGFILAPVPESSQNSVTQIIRRDAIALSGEKMAEGITGNTILMFGANQQSVDIIKQNKFLGHLSPMQTEDVYALGYDSFRLDYYSASNVLDRIEQLFK